MLFIHIIWFVNESLKCWSINKTSINSFVKIIIEPSDMSIVPSFTGVTHSTPSDFLSFWTGCWKSVVPWCPKLERSDCWDLCVSASTLCWPISSSLGLTTKSWMVIWNYKWFVYVSIYLYLYISSLSLYIRKEKRGI